MPQPISITRRQLAKRLITRGAARNKDAADHMIESVLLEITQALRAEQMVRLKGFGTFRVIPTGERHIQKHVKTGESFCLPASRRVRFTASQQVLNPAVQADSDSDF